MGSKHERHYKEESLAPTTTDPTPQVIDDQTPIDSIEKNTSKSDELGGFDKRLPAGTERTVHVLKDRLGDKNPIVVRGPLGKLIGTYDEIRLEGESQIVHEVDTFGCRSGSVCVRTSGSILVRKGK